MKPYEPQVRQICGVDFVFDDYKEPLVQLKALPDRPDLVPVKGYMRGTLPYAASDGRLPCAFCDPNGQRTDGDHATFDRLGRHVRIHGLTRTEYRERIGLLRRTALASEKQRAFSRTLAATQPKPAGFGIAHPQPHPEAQRARVLSPEYQNKRGVCRDQIIAVARAAAKRNGGVLLGHELKRQGIRPRVLKRHGWNGFRALCEEIGATPGVRRWRLTDAELLTDLRETAIKCGRTPRRDDLVRLSLPGRSIWEHHFGSWAQAVRLADLPPNMGTPVEFGDEIDVLNRYALTGRVGRVAQQLHHRITVVSRILARYGVEAPQHPRADQERRKAQEWAAEVAQRLAS